jgi:hypothetical protein
MEKEIKMKNKKRKNSSGQILDIGIISRIYKEYLQLSNPFSLGEHLGNSSEQKLCRLLLSNFHQKM